MCAKKKKRKKKELEKEKWYEVLKDETKRSILAVVFFVFGLIFTFASFGKAGVIGNSFYKILNTFFGTGFFLVPTILFISAVSLFFCIKPNFLGHTLIGGTLFLFSSLGAADIIFGEKTGGYVGYFIAWPFLNFFDYWISLIILCAIFVISFLVIFDTPLSLKFKSKKEKDLNSEEESEDDEEEEEIDEDEEEKEEEETNKKKESATSKAIKAVKEKISTPSKKEEEPEINSVTPANQFILPPLKLLESDRGKPSSGDIKANANIIKRTLQNFGIEVEMGEINIGPSVTQYTLKPAEGVKLSRIIALQNDLSLSLAAYPLRIEAPIPSKSLVGIEIPNSNKTIIGLASLLSEETFQRTTNPLLLALGRDVAGKAVFTNLAKMPHMLVAGATGAGKSIFIHSLIVSLIYHNSPESLRFVMIDPKRVELTIYNKIPHMLTPVITDAKKSILTLKWACKEMERRYDELLKAGVRDIASFHKKHGSYNLMPYLIIVIDELADLMTTFPREMEASIVRLAQMSRAVGIHLVVSTQRPSVEVITGLIKANITARVAMQVASQIDSRTILDMAGAEKLLGSGDMLYLAGDTSKPKRIQGSLISEKEIKEVVKYLSDQYKNVDLETSDVAVPQPEDTVSPKKAIGQTLFNIDFDEEEKDADDEFYEEAKEMIIQTGRASTSYLQRKFKIGYARAARLMDILEERGVIGPGDGAKPREVLISAESEEAIQEAETEDEEEETEEEEE